LWRFALKPLGFAIFSPVLRATKLVTPKSTPISLGDSGSVLISTVYRDVQAEELHIPLTQVIYVGDGASDIPCFSLLNEQQGITIGVYKDSTPQDWKEIEISQSQRLINLASAEYSEDSELMRSLTLAVESLAQKITPIQLSVDE
jgi:hypothetical protein